MTTEADSYELLPEGDQTKRGGASFIDTVERPDAVTAAASMDRLKLTDDGIGCVALAVDTAETIQAQNSIEKMLAHQLAAAHKLAMTFAGKAQRLIEEDGSGWNSQPTIYAAEASRVANASHDEEQRSNIRASLQANAAQDGADREQSGYDKF